MQCHEAVANDVPIVYPNNMAYLVYSQMSNQRSGVSNPSLSSADSDVALTLLYITNPLYTVTIRYSFVSAQINVELKKLFTALINVNYV